MKDKIAGCLGDAARAALTGLAAAVCILALLFLIGLPVNGFDWKAALQLGRSGLFIIGALALFILAGLLLKKDGGGGIQKRDSWKKHFRVLGLAPVTLIIAVMILAVGMAVDYGLFGME